MVALDCNVKNCMHNDENLCCKGTILIEGDDACHKDETCCSSFDKRTGDQFTNRSSMPDHFTSVECAAVNCIFNEERYCHANHISISGSGAKLMDETRCSSFEMQ